MVGTEDKQTVLLLHYEGIFIPQSNQGLPCFPLFELYSAWLHLDGCITHKLIIRTQNIPCSPFPSDAPSAHPTIKVYLEHMMFVTVSIVIVNLVIPNMWKLMEILFPLQSHLKGIKELFRSHAKHLHCHKHHEPKAGKSRTRHLVMTVQHSVLCYIMNPPARVRW